MIPEVLALLAMFVASKDIPCVRMADTVQEGKTLAVVVCEWARTADDDLDTKMPVSKSAPGGHT